MKIAVIIVRVLMGLLFLFSSTVYFLNLVPQPELIGDLKLFNEGMAASHYMLPLIKTVEMICAIAFIVGRLVPLATVVIFPVIVNIVFVHAFLAPEGLPIAIFLLAGNLFLAFVHRSIYKPLLVVK